MPSIGTEIAQRKQRKVLVTIANPRMWTSAQVLTALQLTTLSAPVQLLGASSTASATMVTDKNLGSGAVVNADTDLALVFAASGSGLGNVGVTDASAGELLRSLGVKFTIGTKIYGNLVTLLKVQRTDKGGSTTMGVPGNDVAFPQTSTADGDGYGTFWVVVDSFGNAGPTNGNGRGSLTGLVPVRVLAF